MPKGIDTAVHKTVTAKLRERGMSEQAAEQLASSKKAEALAHFNEKLVQYGGRSEAAYERAFVDLSTWASQFA